MIIPKPKTDWVSAVTSHMAILESSSDDNRKQIARQEIKLLAEFVDGLDTDGRFQEIWLRYISEMVGAE